MAEEIFRSHSKFIYRRGFEMKTALLSALVLILTGFGALSAQAQSQAPANGLTLSQYLEQVKANNPEARAAVLNAQSADLRFKEVDAPVIPELYGEYNRFDRKLEQNSTFAQERVEGDQWKAGVRKQWSFGLQSDVYFNAIRSDLTLPPSTFVPFRSTNYMESTLGLDLKQPLWRNGFGDSTRANMEANYARLRAEQLKAKFALKSILLKAEDTYWSLVSQNQIIRLQEENVDRSGKMRDLMRRKFGQRLVDDVDSLQALASYETRELELLASRDERATVARQFNTLRGMNSDEVPEKLDPFPEKELGRAFPEKAGIAREDFQSMVEEAKALEMKARAARSDIQPKLDLVASMGSNGIDGVTTESYSEAQQLKHPFWSVGIQFSVALDVGKIHAVRQGYEASRRAARDQAENAEFAFQRTYRDLISKYSEAQKRFQKAQSLESTQTDLVKRERQRLLNGRSTTFQTLTFEQNLAAAQIQRVKSQQALVQFYNVLKTFEVEK